MQLGEDVAQMLHGPEAARDAAIGDEGHGLGPPLAVCCVDERLERCRVGMVVLGRHDDKSLRPGDAGAERLPALGRGVLDSGGVDDVEREILLGGDQVRGPAGDRVAEAALPRAAVDQGEVDLLAHALGAPGLSVHERGHRTSSMVEVKGMRQAGPSSIGKALTVGEVAERSGLAVSAIHFYEAKGLIRSWRSPGNQRRYPREVLRRVAVIKVAQRVGVPSPRSPRL